MDRSALKSIFAAVAAASAMAVCAAGSEARWYLQVDNDVVFGEDRWYSSGIRIARVKDDFEWGVLQEIYTPEGKRFSEGTVDRRPAGRLLAYGAFQCRMDDFFQTLELALGMRGPSALGRQATENIHHVIAAPYVDWSRQYDNEVDAHAGFVHSQRFGEAFKVHVGGVLGNQVAFAHAGFEARVGANPRHSSQLLRYVATPPFDPRETRGWSGYAGVSGRVVARNALLTSGYDPLAPPPTRKRTVVRSVAGVAWTRSWGAVTFEVAQDSREFDEQRVPQRFGSAAVHIAF